ncbi:Phospholipid-transporting ATPase 1 [Hordeum vulgare]|nr:Phospholipid-transporting ATPase 1 [Hordeum vulgare]
MLPPASPPSPRLASRPLPPAKASLVPLQDHHRSQEEEGADARGASQGVGEEKAPESRDEAAAVMAIVVVAQREDTVARVAAAMREALLYLGLNPGQHGLVNAVVAAGSIGSFAFPRMVLQESSSSLVTHPIPGFHLYLQASRLSGECSREVSVVALSTPAPTPIDFNATPVAGGSSPDGLRKHAREMSAHMLSPARNLLERVLVGVKDDRANLFMQSIILEGDAAAGYDPEETQSQDDRGSFMPSTYDQAGMHATFMQDQVGLDLDGFPLDDVFPDDYVLEEEDEALQALEPFKVQFEGKSFHLSHCWRIIKDEEKFKAQYATLMACGGGGEEAVEEVREGDKPRPRGKPNSRKEDKRDAALIALIATVEGMMTKKDSREEKCRQDKEVQMNVFMEIQRRRLEMEAEK